MIDVENLVFDTVFNGVQTVRNDVAVSKGFIEENATFPCIVIRETNNVPVDEMNTDPCAENFTRLTYQIEVFSDKAGTARSECRLLLNIVDGIMQNMKFRRTYMSEPFNVNRTIFRQYTRYTVIVDKGTTVVSGEGQQQTTTTTYQTYRR